MSTEYAMIIPVVRVLQVGLYADQLRPGAARIWWLSRLLTPTSRYQPVRMICAKPAASFRAVLLICMLRAALACLASMQMTGSPIVLKACQCQLDSGPLSSPMRTACGVL